MVTAGATRFVSQVAGRVEQGQTGVFFHTTDPTFNDSAETFAISRLMMLFICTLPARYCLG
jgi:hypothetical protein